MVLFATTLLCFGVGVGVWGLGFGVWGLGLGEGEDEGE